MNILLAVLSVPFCWLLYALSGLFPRDPAKVVFGAPKDRFADNSKYLFLEAVREGMPVCWITGDTGVVRQLRSAGLPVHHRWSVPGLWWALRAGTYVVTCYANDVNFWTSRGCRLVNLWHGVPLKKIERSVRAGPVSRRHQGTLTQRLPYLLLAPHVYRKPDVLLVPSPELVEIFAEAFAIDSSRMLIGGYPRNAVLSFEDHPLRRTRGNLTEDESLRLFGIARVPPTERLILYAPTWRDDGRDFAESCPIDWHVLDRELAARQARLTLRLHPAARMSTWDSTLTRITLERTIDDIYPYLPVYDCLLTDYSSIYLDFLFLDRQIVFYPYDLDRYRSDVRGMYFDYESFAPGTIATDFPGLLSALFEADSAADIERRAALVRRLRIDQRPISARELHMITGRPPQGTPGREPRPSHTRRAEDKP